MKANVWGYEKLGPWKTLKAFKSIDISNNELGVGKTMDVSLENFKNILEPKWAHFGRRKNLETSEKVYEMMKKEDFRQTSDGPWGSITNSSRLKLCNRNETSYLGFFVTWI